MQSLDLCDACHKAQPVRVGDKILPQITGYIKYAEVSMPAWNEDTLLGWFVPLPYCDMRKALLAAHKTWVTWRH